MRRMSVRTSRVMQERRGSRYELWVPFDLSAWRFGDSDSKRYVQSAWGRWIPAFAGMTVVDCENDGYAEYGVPFDSLA